MHYTYIKLEPSINSEFSDWHTVCFKSDVSVNIN